jgi:hypothetical protein
MLHRTPFFLRHDPNVSAVRRVFGHATLGELGVVLTNLFLFVTCLGASVFTVTLAATLATSLGLKLTGILP